MDFCEIVDDKSQSDNGAGNGDVASEILLDHQVSASLVRQRLFQTDDIPDFNTFEASLVNLFKAGDQIFQMINSNALIYTKLRLQYYLVKELQFETSLNPILKGRFEGPTNEKLSDMLQPVLKALETFEDAEAPLVNYFVDDSQKALAPTLRYTDHALSDLRIRVRSFFIRLNNEKGLSRYE